MEGVSLFVGNLHQTIAPEFLRNYFVRAGNLKDVYIPNNQSPFSIRKYGFVRFSSKEEAAAVARRCNGDYVWGNNIIVKPALRERREAIQRREVFQRRGAPQPHLSAHAKTVQPKKYWYPSSRTENRATPQECANLDFNSKDGALNWLKGCSVGYLSKSRDINALQGIIRSQGIYCTLTYLGGKMLLLSFFSEDLMKACIQKHKEWFLLYFDFIKPWEEMDIPATRYVWLKCDGIPLHAWDEDFFALIGNLYGKFEALDEDTKLKRRLDFGMMLVLTPELQRIDRKHRVRINGKVFDIHVREDPHKNFNPANDMQLLGNGEDLEKFLTGENHQGMATGSEVGEAQPARIQISNSNLNSSNGHLEPTLELGCNPNTLGPILEYLDPRPISPFRPTPPSPNTSVLPTTSVTHNPADLLNPPEPVESSDSTLVPNTYSETPEAFDHGEQASVDVEVEDISLEEVFNTNSLSRRRSCKKVRRIEKRKAINSIVYCRRGGKLLKQELIKKAKKHRSKHGRDKSTSGDRDLTPEHTSEVSVSEENIRNKKEEIRKVAERAWKIGKALGMTAPPNHTDEDVLHTFEVQEERAWADSERRHKE